jgi:tRNA-binding protein
MSEGPPITPAPIKAAITPDVLERVDVRVGTIVAVHDVAGSNRLVQMQVDFGDAVKTVVVGMKQERANPAEVVGRQALFVVNLEPRRIHGILSEALLFDVGYQDGITPALACPERPVPNGTRVG